MRPNDVKVLKLYAYFLADHYSKDKKALNLLTKAANYHANNITSAAL
jgi:hypothetical protein